jgi:hypothetical protein
MRTVLALALVLVPASAAQAGWSVGVRLGFPIYAGPCWGYYRPYPPPYYVGPPVIVQPAPVIQTVPVAPAYAAPVPAYAPPAPVPTDPPPPPLAPLARAARPSESSAWEGLSSPDERTRADAIMQLGRSKDRRAVEPLTRALREDRSPTVREAAARGLGLIGAPAALSALQHAAQADDDRDVRRSAAFAAEVLRANFER